MLDPTNLQALFHTMEPTLCGAEYVFCSIPLKQVANYWHLDPLAIIKEKERLTVILPLTAARQAALEYDAVFALITLTFEPNLETIGLTAAIATQLTKCGINANVIAGYNSDHIFVPQEYAVEALSALCQLREEGTGPVLGFREKSEELSGGPGRC